MGIVTWLVWGLFVGALARLLLPGSHRIGIAMTVILGVVGSLLGGLVGSMISGDEITRLHPAGIIGSVIGAILVLGIVGWIGRKRQVTV